MCPVLRKPLKPKHNIRVQSNTYVHYIIIHIEKCVIFYYNTAEILDKFYTSVLHFN